MNETEIRKKLEDLQEKVDAILKYQEFEQLTKRNKSYVEFKKRMKNMEFETKV